MLEGAGIKGSIVEQMRCQACEVCPKLLVEIAVAPDELDALRALFEGKAEISEGM